MVNCCEFLVSDPLFLKSGHGQVNVTLNKSYSVLTRRDQVPGTTFTLQRPGPELSWQLLPGQVPRLSSAVTAEGARHPTQLALRVVRQPKEGRPVPQTATQADSHHY